MNSYDLIMTAQQQTLALKDILLQLQISASKVSDAEFKKMGAKDLMASIQNCKHLIRYSESLEVVNELNEYSDSLGLYNEM